MAHISDLTQQLPQLKLETGPQDLEALKTHLGRARQGHEDSYNQSRGDGNDIATTSIDHVATPPIDVPVKDGFSNSLQLGDSDDFLKNRIPSISFNPQVKLDSGDQHTLGQSMKNTEKRTGRVRVRGRSLLQELSDQKMRSPAGRTRSETDRNAYDPMTGKAITDRRLHSDIGEDRFRLHVGESRHPLLQDTVDELAISGIHRPTSFTSDSTMSPVMAESARDWLSSPPPTPLPMHAKSYEEPANSWNINGEDNCSRAKSYTPGSRSGSLRSALRQNSRRSNSSSYSPASMFLSQWSSTDIPPEPDDEGQQIGDDYVLGKKIGFGGFSTVKEAYTIEGGHRITRAVKIVRKFVPGRSEQENDEVQAEFEHEVSLWRCLHHRHILPLLAVYETDFATFCITRLNLGGTLFDLIRKHRRGLEAPLSKRYAYQLASALRYLHEDVRVVHRDVKLENCLLDISNLDTAPLGGDVILCDFGMAEFITSDHRDHSPDPYENASDRPPPKNIGPAESSTSVAGSLQYASPELINSPGGLLDPVTDLWAYGVVVFALCVGDLPFQHSFQPRLRTMIEKGTYDQSLLQRIDGSDQEDVHDAIDLINNCLQIDVDQRWNIREVLGCFWFKEVQDVDEVSDGGWHL